MSDISELRRDPVSQDWVIIATGRAKLPVEFKQDILPSVPETGECPFEDPEKSGNKVIFSLPQGDWWWVKVIENKFPVVQGIVCGIESIRGPYTVQAGAGYHEVVITRDHMRSFGEMTQEEVTMVVETYRQRYMALRELNCANYILIFHNHGRKAGASLPHPHSQIVAIPVIPADVRRSLSGSRRYHEKTGECAHCAMLAWEIKEKLRIVWENEHMVVLSPFVPRDAFELRIYPRVHSSYFEKLNPQEVQALAEALRMSLGKLYVGLGNPDYNFFIHTAPVKDLEEHGYYHWHIEIIPKTMHPPAGFELGTGVDVSEVNPDAVASYLRDIER